jgi:hypothetical protein
LRLTVDEKRTLAKGQYAIITIKKAVNTMTSESPLKRLLLGNLDVLKNDDPSLINDFLDSFQGLEIKSSSVFSMLFMRACHFDSVKIATHMLNNNLIQDIDAHDQGALRSAIRNDSHDMLSLLLERGASQNINGLHSLAEACSKGAVDCIKGLIFRARLSMDGISFDELLDKSTVELIKNLAGKSPESIVTALKILKEEGASMTGKKENLLASAVLATKNSDMIPVVKFLAAEGQTEHSYKSAKSALQTLVTQNNPASSINRSKSPHDSFKALRAIIETTGPRRAEHTQQRAGNVPGL